MKTIFYLHWNEEELNERVTPLLEAGYTVIRHWQQGEAVKFNSILPEVFIVSLARLPSHGRHFVQWLWEAKKRQAIPVLFVDGAPDKIAATKSVFPKAVYCTGAALIGVLKTL